MQDSGDWIVDVTKTNILHAHLKWPMSWGLDTDAITMQCDEGSEGVCRRGLGTPAKTLQPKLSGRLPRDYKEPIYLAKNSENWGKKLSRMRCRKYWPFLLNSWFPNKTCSCSGILCPDSLAREDSATLLPFYIWGFYQHSGRRTITYLKVKISVIPSSSTW